MAKTEQHSALSSAVGEMMSSVLSMIEKKYGIAGLDQALVTVEERRKSLLYEANKERNWEPK